MNDERRIELLRKLAQSANREPKKCNHCGGQVLTYLSSVDEFICHDCYKHTDWLLAPGQESVLIEGKVGT